MNPVNINHNHFSFIFITFILYNFLKISFDEILVTSIFNDKSLLI